jgi:polyphosphate kinase
VSDNITVVSVVGRFLEHSRIFTFERNGQDPVVYIGSADLMPRNLDDRVELTAPVEDPALRAELLETLELCLADNTSAWTLDEHGEWTRRLPANGDARSVQRELMRRHAERAAEAPPGT